MRMKPILVILAAVLIAAAAPFVMPRPTVYHHRYQGHKLSCLWNGTPPDGFYDVRYGSDGTRDGSITFSRNGVIVATCNIADDF
jgi:hypothetical protein